MHEVTSGCSSDRSSGGGVRAHGRAERKEGLVAGTTCAGCTSLGEAISSCSSERVGDEGCADAYCKSMVTCSGVRRVQFQVQLGQVLGGVKGSGTLTEGLVLLLLRLLVALPHGETQRSLREGWFHRVPQHKHT